MTWFFEKLSFFFMYFLMFIRSCLDIRSKLIIVYINKSVSKNYPMEPKKWQYLTSGRNLRLFTSKSFKISDMVISSFYTVLFALNITHLLGIRQDVSVNKLLPGFPGSNFRIVSRKKYFNIIYQVNICNQQFSARLTFPGNTCLRSLIYTFV
jgi:hypothetical protein